MQKNRPKPGASVGSDVGALLVWPDIRAAQNMTGLASVPFESQTFPVREIGEVLGVTESRISQLHTKAVLRLKSRLQGDNLRD